MPIYEYRCQGCQRKVSVFARTFLETPLPTCTQCNDSKFTRVISNVAVLKPWGSSLTPPSFESIDDVDENNPEAMTEWMHRIKTELGDSAPDLGATDLLDAGIPPDTKHGD